MRNVIFARAGQVFRKQWIHDYFSKQPWYQPGGFDPKKVSKQGHANSRAIVAWELHLPKAELLKRLAMELGKRPTSATEEGVARQIEIQLLAIATGSTIPEEMYSTRNSMLRRDPITDPTLLKAALDVRDLDYLSRRDLRIIRNTMFALHGRPFKTESMRTWFSRMEWYREDPKYTDKLLTKVDLENIKLIRSVENSIGGPETEDEVDAEKNGATQEFAGA